MGGHKGDTKKQRVEASPETVPAKDSEGPSHGTHRDCELDKVYSRVSLEYFSHAPCRLFIGFLNEDHANIRTGSHQPIWVKTGVCEAFWKL
jgi:hypothetical protein